jgi:hypothetical protein
MKDARGLEVTAADAAAVAATDDFTARLLRLDQGVEAILDAVKRAPQTPILQLLTAAFWLYGQTDGALESARPHLTACAALAMNPRERALHRALTSGTKTTICVPSKPWKRSPRNGRAIS